MKAALIGFVQSGKSTLLSALNGQEAALSGSSSVLESVVRVPDVRVDWLTGLYQPKKTVYATIDCLDVPGLSFSDEANRNAARRIVDQTRSADMFVIVVRAFENEAVAPYRGSIDPLRDIKELQAELLLSDLALVMTRIEKLEKQVHKPTATQEQDKKELALQLKLQEALESEKPVSAVVNSEQDMELVRALGFFTLKPIMVVVNVGEEDLQKDFGLQEAVDDSVPVVSLCAQIEAELAQLDDDSKKEFMSDLGISEPAVNKFINSCYSALGLVSFLTVGADEVRAWPLRKDTCALDAAGKIHSDIKRGFIRAETMAYSELHELGSEKAMKAAGKTRLEGKTYIVQDGDVLNFRFNV